MSNWKRIYHGKRASPDWGDRVRCPICDQRVARRLDGTTVAHLREKTWCVGGNTQPDDWYGPDE